MLLHTKNFLDHSLCRHVSEVFNLSWPVIIARSGMMAMAFVDAVMVGRFSTLELAYLSIGLILFMPVFLVLLGMVFGTLVMTSTAFGAENYSECGAVWRRSIPYSVFLGLFGFVIAFFGEELLRFGGQQNDMAKQGGQVMFYLGLGLPAYLVTVTSQLFLEGIKQPKIAVTMLIIANLFNIVFNWVFVYGHFGIASLGAEGSAIATAIVRWLLAIALVTYIWFMPCNSIYAVRRAPKMEFRLWSDQRRVGYSSAVSIGGESIAFSVIGLFAGWLGEVSLAAYSIAHNLIAMAFMVSLGVASATVVRVGVARGQGNKEEMRMAGWTGLGVNTFFMIIIGFAFMLFSEFLAKAYTNDPVVSVLAAPLIVLCGIIVITDGGQAVMVNALRGSGGIWAPALIQNLAFILVMVPMGWWFAINKNGGPIQLYEAIFVGTSLSLILLAFRFSWISRAN